MAKIGDAFPGAALLFATLSSELGDGERETIKEFVQVQRERQVNFQQYHPVVVLTGVELFSPHGAPECWKGCGGLYDKFAESRFDASDLHNLADATQQLYLGMNSWMQYREEVRKKREH